MSERPKTDSGTILVVDDLPDNIRVLNEILKERHRVLFATDGPRALEIAQAQQPDLILLDVMMPEMDGYAVCRKLKELERTKEIPVIFITALDRMEDELEGLGSGAVDYIVKPFHPRIVQVRVSLHLELKRHRDFLAKLSSADGLTGIANRRRLEEVLQSEWARAGRNGTEVSLIMGDIDRFKPYNDDNGHLAGDDCLKRVAEALASCVHRPGDLVARYGGEEFCAVLVGCSANGAAAIAETMRKAVWELEADHPSNPPYDRVSISLGVGTRSPAPGTPMEPFRESVDQALYRAKNEGRNRVETISGDES